MYYYISEPTVLYNFLIYEIMQFGIGQSSRNTRTRVVVTIIHDREDVGAPGDRVHPLYTGRPAKGCISCSETQRDEELPVNMDNRTCGMPAPGSC